LTGFICEGYLKIKPAVVEEKVLPRNQMLKTRRKRRKRRKRRREIPQKKRSA